MSRRKPPAVNQHVALIKHLEEEGDAIYHEAVGALFAGNPNPLGRAIFTNVTMITRSTAAWQWQIFASTSSGDPYATSASTWGLPTAHHFRALIPAVARPWGAAAPSRKAGDRRSHVAVQRLRQSHRRTGEESC